jgi:acetyl-CoA carboxylase biotin carboxyl carrier protein
MDLKEIKAIIDLMTRNGLSEFELEKGEVKLRVKRGPSGEWTSTSIPVASAPAAPTVSPVLSHALPPSAPAAPTTAPVAGSQIVSPMVGTFYRSPSPDSPPYIEVGQEVKEDTVVCIIEAMKVMNEIKAEVAGVISEVLAQNGKPVEFGKALFAVRTN